MIGEYLGHARQPGGEDLHEVGEPLALLRVLPLQ